MKLHQKLDQMKVYNLIYLEQSRKIGKIEAKDLGQINIVLEDLYRYQYEKTFVRLIDSLNEQGNFGVNYHDWTIKSASKNFWAALVQSLMLDLGILVVPEK